MATPEGQALAPVDELDFLASGTLMRRSELQERDAETRKLAPNRQFYFRKNADLDSLIEAASRKLAQNGGSVRAYMIRGNSYMKKGMLAEAHGDYSAVLQLDAQHVEAAYLRGTVRHKLGQIDEAIADFSLALQLDPNHVKAAYSRAACYNLAGRFDEAFKDYDAALARDQGRSLDVRRLRATPRAHSALSSSTASPTSSISSLPGFPSNGSPLAAKLERARVAGGGAAGPKQLRRKSSSQPEAPATSHFSIAAVLRPSAQPGIARQQPTQQQQQLPRQQQWQQQASSSKPASPPASVDAALDACESSSGAASVSGRSLGGSQDPAPWRDVQHVLQRLALQDGSASVPLEVAALHEAQALSGQGGLAAAAAATGTRLQFSPSRGRAAAAAAATAAPLPASSSTAGAEDHHARGYALRKQGDFKGAVAEYSAALAADPRHFRALFNRAFSYDKLGKYHLALADYETAIELDPSSSYAHYNAGIARDRLGDYEGAVASFSAAIALEADNPDFYHNRGFALRKMERFEGAVRDYSAAIDLHPHHVKALYNRAVAYERLRQYTAALQDFSTVLELDPQNGPAYLNRAGLLYKMRQPEAALADVDAALALECSASPGRSSNAVGAAPAWHMRGEVLVELGQGQEALQAYERACALDPGSVTYLRSYGLGLRSAGQHDAAARVLSRLLAASPHDEVALSARGFCHRKLQAWPAAVADYTVLLNLSERTGSGSASGAVRLYNSRAFCLASMGRLDEAIADWDAVLALDPRNVHALHNRGISLDKLGRHREAVEAFSAVIALQPDNATAYFNRAAALDSLGLFEAAVLDYRKALDGDK